MNHSQKRGRTVAQNDPAALTDDDLRAFVEEHGITTFKVGAVDIDGLARGKRIAAPYFLESVARKGTNISNILFGWDMHDEPIPGLSYTSWDTGYPDVTLLPDLSTLKLVPWEPGTASVVCDVHALDGAALDLAPRQVLRRVLAQAEQAGFTAKCGYELEFYLLKDGPDALAARGFRDLETLTRGHHTYSVCRDTASEHILGEIRDQLAAYGIYIEASNSEHGPGQFEVNMRYCDALHAADSALLLKQSIKELAARHGYTATFIAKLSSAWAGSSGHLHQSLETLDGELVFARDAEALSPLGESFVAGVLELAQEMTAFYLPTINSYKRTEGASWAGSSATWGFDNRTVALRAIPSAGAAARVENRIAGADANPYLVIAASLASGLHGIAKGLTPPPAVVGNGYEQAGKETLLPQTLEDATRALEASNQARSLLGEVFVDHYVATRRWEIQQARAAVTDWELARYVEHV